MLIIPIMYDAALNRSQPGRLDIHVQSQPALAKFRASLQINGITYYF